MESRDLLIDGLRWNLRSGSLLPVDVLGTLVIDAWTGTSVAGGPLTLPRLTLGRGGTELIVDDHFDCVDEDRDGVCVPDDCNDADPGVAPGRLERRGDGIDQDCDLGTPDTGFAARKPRPRHKPDPTPIGRLGGDCDVRHYDSGSASTGDMSWNRTVLVVCGGRRIAAVPVPGRLTEHLRPRFADLAFTNAPPHGPHGSLGEAIVESGRIVIDGRAWTLSDGVLATPAAAPPPGLELTRNEYGRAVLRNGTDAPIDVSGLAVHGSWMRSGWDGGDDGIVLSAALPEGTVLGPGDTLRLNESSRTWGDLHVWFMDEDVSVWAGETQVLP